MFSFNKIGFILLTSAVAVLIAMPYAKAEPSCVDWYEGHGAEPGQARYFCDLEKKARARPPLTYKAYTDCVNFSEGHGESTEMAKSDCKRGFRPFVEPQGYEDCSKWHRSQKAGWIEGRVDCESKADIVAFNTKGYKGCYKWHLSHDKVNNRYLSSHTNCLNKYELAAFESKTPGYRDCYLWQRSHRKNPSKANYACRNKSRIATTLSKESHNLLSLASRLFHHARSIDQSKIAEHWNKRGLEFQKEAAFVLKTSPTKAPAAR